MKTNWESKWNHTTRRTLWVLLQEARAGQLEPDWRVRWAERTAEALRQARSGVNDWWRGESARHIRAVSPLNCTGLLGADPVGAGEELLLVLRELAANDAEVWWAWEPARAPAVGSEQALRAWWSAALDVIDADEAAQLEELAGVRGGRPGGVFELREWARSSAEIRDGAQQRRDLINESAVAAATAMKRLGVRCNTYTLKDYDERGMVLAPVFDDWVEEARRRVRRWPDEDGATAHLAKLADPAYREKLERIPEYWS